MIGRNVQVLEYVPELRAPDVFDGKHEALERVTWGDGKSACADQEAEPVHVPVRICLALSHQAPAIAYLMPVDRYSRPGLRPRAWNMAPLPDPATGGSAIAPPDTLARDGLKGTLCCLGRATNHEE